jgi:hypothetical protein
MVRVAAKWGFGNAPLKNSHREKTEAAIHTVIQILRDMPDSPEIEQLEAISHVKGQFTRTIKQDQWDWYTVWSLLGRPLPATCKQDLQETWRIAVCAQKHGLSKC